MGILISLVVIPFWVLIMSIMKIVYSFMDINTSLPIIEVVVWTIFYSILCPIIYYCYNPLWKYFFCHLKIGKKATFNFLSQLMTLLNGIFVFYIGLKLHPNTNGIFYIFSITLGHQLIGHITGFIGTISFSLFFIGLVSNGNTRKYVFFLKCNEIL